MAIVVDLVYLPPDIEEGAKIGPRFQSSQVMLSSGAVTSNQDWAEELTEADISYGMQADVALVDPEDGFLRILEFFRERRGRHRGFLFNDPTNNHAEKQPLRVIDGAVNRWQLCQKFGTVVPYLRRLTRPKAGTLTLYKDGIAVPAAGGSGVPAWTLEPLGVIKFAGAVPAGAYTATFDFDTPMQFMDDAIAVNLKHIRAGAVPSITIRQVRE